MRIKKLREKYNLSQQHAADIANVPLRTFVRYEQDDQYGDSYKREGIIKRINDICEINETKGLLTIQYISNMVKDLFDTKYAGLIDYCYLFGSYAKGYEKEDSDVDLCVSTKIEGLDFVGLIEDLRNLLHKKIDLIRFDTLKNNFDLKNEIMKGGIRILGQQYK